MDFKPSSTLSLADASEYMTAGKVLEELVEHHIDNGSLASGVL
jgi:hypothetical protein